jgi:xylulokinase
MSNLILAYDLGTGGIKATLHDETGASAAGCFVSYDTSYPAGGWHEQRPDDWWDAIVASTKTLLSTVPEAGRRIAGIALSGQSLGVVPVDAGGHLLREYTPIWSDTRSHDQTTEFFSHTDPESWYLTTGNGFPAECYAIFKAMWYRDREPEMFRETRWILGSKDYINLKLTGRAVTDYSYASGSGVYNLLEWRYEEAFFEAARMDPDCFPTIVPSTEVIGELRPEPASVLGLKAGVPIVAGGVDNSCMALGARNTAEGRVYTSLGSSAWIAVSSGTPVVDRVTKPYVFAHVVPGLFTSAVSIFAAGSSYRWARDVLLGACGDLPGGRSPYVIMDEMASRSPVGANHLLFNPSMAGGSSQEPSAGICGGFHGLELRHSRDDLIRSVMEGVALNLGSVLSILKGFVALDSEMLMVGGGARSGLWRQIIADVYGMRVIKTNVDQDAGSLGAAALGAVGVGMWSNFERVEGIHRTESTMDPDPGNAKIYAALMPVFERTRTAGAEVGEMLHALGK